ncbi:MAG: helix-turn-helix domain-containing protein [Leptospirales bacterium]
MKIGSILYFISFLLFVNSLIHLWRINNFKYFGLGLLLFIASIVALKYGLFYTGDIIHYPRLLGIEPWMQSITVTIYMFYIPSLGGCHFHWKDLKNLILCVPLLQFYLYAGYFLMDNTWHQKVVEIAMTNGQPFVFPNTLSVTVLGVYNGVLFPWAAYLFLKIFLQKKVTGPKTSHIKTGFSVVIIWALFTTILSTLYARIYFLDLPLPAWNPLLMYGSAYLFFLFWQVWPYYIKAGSVMFETSTFKIGQAGRSYLDGIDLNALHKNFTFLMEEEKIYQDDELSLPGLADKLQVSVHQLSEYFNRSLKTRFIDYINALRIKESKRMLDKEPEKSITEICYEVGFNSNSVFYRIFKKFTGHTPKTWREKKK